MHCIFSVFQKVFHPWTCWDAADKFEPHMNLRKPDGKKQFQYDASLFNFVVRWHKIDLTIYIAHLHKNVKQKSLFLFYLPYINMHVNANGTALNAWLQ